jgi:hypothetical protein
MCDDIDATVDELRAKGAHFRGRIEEREYGRIIMMIVPGPESCFWRLRAASVFRRFARIVSRDEKIDR